MRGLQKAGVSVHVVLTRSAAEFVAPLTFEALSTHPVITHMFRSADNREIQHIGIAQEVQLLAVAPATANILGKFAHGIADDFLSTLYLSCPAPVLLAPAMNVEMWRHPAVQENVARLKARGHLFVDPEPGMLACGMEGQGRLAEVDVIVGRILDALSLTASLAGLKVLVTAGPTIEDLDPVRFISNRSSGKMGYAVAEAAGQRGADVYLVSGPTQLPPPRNARLISVRSAAEMKEAVVRLYADMDVVVKAAAVADYRPVETASQKLKKTPEGRTIQLVPTEDILALLGRQKTHQVLIGFAAETQDLALHARDKMKRKNLDFVVANDVTNGVFGEDRSSVQIFSPDAEPVCLQDVPKSAIAHRVLDLALAARSARSRDRASGGQ
jgi:phosphopantothenoylcysteine decarboxylase/phosphopantothenate--cysteine ligase